MTPLREQLALFLQPVDVDALRRQVDAAARATEGSRDALRDRVRFTARELGQATEATRDRAEEVGRVDARTRGGVVGTLLSSMNSEGVAKAREDGAFKLYGDLSVLERCIEDARVLAEQVPRLIDDARFGAEVLDGLRQRAVDGGLDAALVAHIAAASGTLRQVAQNVVGAAAPLTGPLDDAVAVAEHAASILKKLRSTARASTVGEALLDGVVSKDSGALGQLARKKVQQAAPGWVPELDRGAATLAQAAAEVDGGRDDARERARRDAEARREAEAELDALEWEP